MITVEICLDFIDNNNTPPLCLVEAPLVISTTMLSGITISGSTISAIIGGMFQGSPFSYKWRQRESNKKECK
jgi:hypothetical protein